MGKIICNGTEIEVKNGERIKHACEELGIFFGCDDGICGSCIITIKKGMKNLTPKTQKEKDANLKNNQRYACQCKLKTGTIKIEF
jgi:ferredoxin